MCANLLRKIEKNEKNAINFALIFKNKHKKAMLSLKISNFVAIMLDSWHIKYEKAYISHDLGEL